MGTEPKMKKTVLKEDKAYKNLSELGLVLLVFFFARKKYR